MILISAAVYLIASAAFLLYLLNFNEKVARAATTTLALALGVHLLTIGVEAFNASAELGSRGGVMLISSAVIVAVFFVSQFRYNIRVAGAVLVPVVTISMYALHIARADSHRVPMAVLNVITPVHIGAIMIGILAFCLSCAAAILLILQEYQLKKKIFWKAFRRVPAMERLDGWSHHSIIVGFPFFTLGLILGAVWIYRSSTAFHIGPQYILSFISWVIYGVLLHMRLTIGWKGTRAAIWTIVGFMFSLGAVLYYVVR